jgi:hypothetical protein
MKVRRMGKLGIREGRTLRHVIVLCRLALDPVVARCYEGSADIAARWYVMDGYDKG